MTIYPFNAEEAFKIAIAVEENGLKFYRQAAAKFSGPVAEMFEGLAKEEDIHKAVFSKILDTLPKGQPSVYDPNNETDQYLQMMADLNIFKTNSSVDEVLAGITNVKDAVKLAIGLEKDSVVFFVQLKNAAAQLSDELSIDKLILEEAKHLRKLAAIHNRLD
ncbi:MAG: ferritin family protein [Deltaproteobacteria bacterium]|jgi:rubrerythrin|nr:ferritin family protein [Deltaproteobacteria bacterium]